MRFKELRVNFLTITGADIMVIRQVVINGRPGNCVFRSLIKVLVHSNMIPSYITKGVRIKFRKSQKTDSRCLKNM